MFPYENIGLGVGESKMTQIVKKCIKHNNYYYYVEYGQCPKELIVKYDKPIKTSMLSYAKQLKRINPETKEFTIYNTLDEVVCKFGHIDKTVKRAVENKTLLSGHLQEYYKNDKDKNNDVDLKDYIPEKNLMIQQKR